MESRSPNGKWLALTVDESGAAVLIAIDDISRVTELLSPDRRDPATKITFKSGSRTSSLDGAVEPQSIVVRESYKELELSLGYDKEQEY
jgi:hypothetical protein